MTENRVTTEGIQAKIKKTTYMVIPDTTVTICHMELENGFSVRGESACVDPANFNATIGEHYAYQNAFEKIWMLEGYLLKQRLYERGQ